MYKIILLGYMASGKTAVGKLLAHQIHLRHIDLDAKIEAKTGMEIPAIFHRKGEIYFRKVEHETLIEVLADPTPIVLSLGGGTPCYADNHKLLAGDNLVSFYLKASIDTLAERLGRSQGRPLVTSDNDEDLKEFVAKHLFERSYFYNKAKYTVIVDDKPLGQIVDEIKTLLT